MNASQSSGGSSHNETPRNEQNEQDVEKSRILDPLRPNETDGPTPKLVFAGIVLGLLLLVMLLGLAVWWFAVHFVAL